ncbi:glycosyl hydrolase family 61-domain-containing protein [Mycena albidolilacea]|uniref:lytic cellulose monooxygenase (C4-dehydrogenating) n=1 Tax=Mycena albidolilacea TaxID=1033008 RepID=A0AAD6ZUB3_9AGAR|nr:glycosyl hydrolase family 61-domain-containing protein [Mycena albidolilacea]
MKFLSILVAVATLAAKVSGHYILPELIVGGVNTSAWQYVRQTNNWQDLNPVTDVSTTDIRCYTSLESGTASTITVAAGSTVGFAVGAGTLYHAGVVNVYMAKAPTGTDVASWDGSGNVWFKIHEVPAVTDGGTSITFPAEELTQVTFPIPTQTPSGQYLIRIEHIALHVATTFGGAQFYIACGQVQVWGTGSPGPLVAFPGAYTVCYYLGSLCINIYWPIPTSYVQPGPPVWPAVGSVCSSRLTKSAASLRLFPQSPPASSTVATTTPPATTTVVTTSSTKASTTTTSSTGSSTGGTVAQWGQCGGSGHVFPPLVFCFHS